MSFEKLKRFEKARVVAEGERAEAEKRRDLRRAVKQVIPKSVRVPKRPRGRTGVGGLSRKEVAQLRSLATAFLDGEAGMKKLEAQVQHTALVILLIDGVLGTEPWRAATGPHGGLIAANARVRYLENATRILDDLRRRSGHDTPKLLEGVIDAEIVTPAPEPA